MKLEKIVEHACRFSRPYAITSGDKFRLRDHNPGDTGPWTAKDKPTAKKALREGVEALAALQDRLYAHDRWGILLIFQAMDAAGKDGAIKHVMSGLNPQGCQVASFKAPSAEELDHDFLWRCQRHLPERGRIGVFNRSYYEEVLVVKVHPHLLDKQKLPPEYKTKHIWSQRYEDICAHEQYLSRNGLVIRKFFLNVSREEQKKRFLERINDPAKNWKFSSADASERGHWDAYMKAYEEMIRKTSSPEAPWYVVPADHKWFTRIIVAAAVIDTLSSLDIHYPKMNDAKRRELAEAKAALLAEAAS
ncbi:MAG TPA: polyphosphate kinase 2 family protein [Kiritimatiellia bacterium]|nr:polyphosphate kinase 2 family protein [Kiritimatiellia bacterium]HMO98209.1 polyphosphate kinase 2 family protein [Kiritimatiellia bacterium]HMP96473.1 polyphosphate kinase 2 family protein [Kiritimatiellia bacterium]